ncbi:hypothetical protein PCANC_13721 [Puccinia coronata f. sp. avenae]|uniref:C3H1-type domain-containing protein n=1 Tax=Puccinia coronata f. sp. avenae TaxID=200324 RepID=A0A2N5VFN0_9BASI|nr:hypothetical protein PCANC_13721 [Puccinia coronata f. sp. avenae]
MECTPPPAEPGPARGTPEPFLNPSADPSPNSQTEHPHSASTSPPSSVARSVSPSAKMLLEPALHESLVTTATETDQQPALIQSSTPQPQSVIPETEQNLESTVQSNPTSTLAPAKDDLHLEPNLSHPTSPTQPRLEPQQEDKSELQPSSSNIEINPTLDCDLLMLPPSVQSLAFQSPFTLDPRSRSSTPDQNNLSLPPISPPVPIMTRLSPARSFTVSIAKPYQPSPLSKKIAPVVHPSLPDQSDTRLIATATSNLPHQPSLGDVNPPHASSSTSAPASRKNAPIGAQNEQKTTTTNNTTSRVVKEFQPKLWKARLTDIRYHLDRISIAPDAALKALGNILSCLRNNKVGASRDWSTVPLDGRLEVMLAIIHNGTSQMSLPAWIRNQKLLSVINCWFHDAVEHGLEKKKEDVTRDPHNAIEHGLSQRTTIIRTVLQLIEKLPMTVETMRLYTFGKLIFRINQSAQDFPDNITQLTGAIESQWRAKLQAARAENEAHPQPSTSAPAGNSASTSAVALKRRLSDSAPTPSNRECAATAPNAKVQTPLSSVNPNRPAAPDSRKRQLDALPKLDKNDVKKRKVILPVQSAREKLTADLFGRPDKTKLPMFAARGGSSTVPPKPVTVASDIDPFTHAMSMLKSRPAENEDLDPFTPLPTTSTKTNNKGKPSKSVRFKPDQELCQVKIVERLVYESDEHELPGSSLDSFPLSDANEGRYLHRPLAVLEEEMEWESPLEVILTKETMTNLETSPLVSAEASIQEARERERESVTYSDESQIPETAQEPAFESPIPEDAPPARQMRLGGELLDDREVARAIAQVQSENGADATVADDQAISSLLSQLWHEGGSSPPVPVTSANYPPPDTADRHQHTHRATNYHQADSSSSVPAQTSSQNVWPRRFPELYQHDLPPHRNSPPAFPQSSSTIDPPLSKKKRKRNKNKNKNFDHGREPPLCRNGANCAFGQNCRFRHED